MVIGSIHNLDGLHRAIGLFLVTSKKDLSKQEVRFLRDEMLMSQYTLGQLLGVSEQAIRRWEVGRTEIPKPSEFLLRLLYRDHVNDQSGKIATLLKGIADLAVAVSRGGCACDGRADGCPCADGDRRFVRYTSLDGGAGQVGYFYQS